MFRKFRFSPILFVIAALFLLAVPPLLAQDVTAEAACRPSIRFTQIPPVGSNLNLKGRVLCLPNPTRYGVATYIYIDDPNNWADGWWSKPTFARPIVPLKANGTFEIPIVTGGIDATALKIAVFVVRKTYPVPLCSGSNCRTQYSPQLCPPNNFSRANRLINRVPSISVAAACPPPMP